ncbi:MULTISPECIES: hypothetical protein [Okeania]|nr:MULTISPECIES: hypothetical protein [Okeania]
MLKPLYVNAFRFNQQALSNRPKENKVQYFKPLTLTRGTDN